MPIDLRLEPDELALLVDLYELTMAASFFEHRINETATFSLAVRRLRENRSYLVAAGTERLIELLEEFRFGPEALEYLDSVKLFSTDFLQYLSQMRFTGSIRVMAEGTIFFADEPILEVSAPLIEAQLLETIALNQLGLASLIASKAARIVAVAGGRRLVDFGLRRAHGADAGLIAARSSYLAGFAGTSNVLAGRRYGIPLYGTMAHSYVMAHESERDAFRHFSETFPQLSTLLVDTYDTVGGVENATRLARDLLEKGVKLQGIRLDSGDLADLSRKARRILDAQGLNEVSIFASGDLDEHGVEELLKAGAPIDAFGVGTEMVVSADSPSLDVTYKLTEYAGKPRIKTSPGKPTLPGSKQVFRASTSARRFCGDLLGLSDERIATVMREFRPAPAEVEPLLQVQFESGRRRLPRPTLSESRERLADGLSRLDPRIKALRRPDSYPVRNTAALSSMLISEKVRAESRQD